MDNNYFCEMRKISKRFGAVQALDNVDFEIGEGEVVGLVGDNAAGKSTLMKILSGAYIADEGTISIKQKKAQILNPLDSKALGIEMLYQNFALAGNINIFQNIYLGREKTKNYLGGLVKILDKKYMAERSAELVSRLKININSVYQKVKELSGGQQQSVAIARVIGFNAKLIIMDEPTANLGVREIQTLLDLIKRLKDQSISIIVISHRLDDIFEVCDRVIILKRGKRIGMKFVSKTSIDQVTRIIVGGEFMGENGQEVTE